MTKLLHLHFILFELTHHSKFILIMLFFVLFFVGWNFESFLNHDLEYNRKNHGFINFPFTLTSIPAQLLLGILFFKIFSWTSAHHFGFVYLNFFKKHTVLMFIASFLFLDLGEYVYHLLSHKFKILWYFHGVHHSDKVLNISTTLREHPIDNITRTVLTALWVFLSGTFLWVFVIRQMIQLFSSLFAHTDFRLTDFWNKIFGSIFTTPNHHQVHHHHKMPFTNKNYGDVLIIWDRIFGTFAEMNQKELVFGVDFYNKKAELSSFSKVFMMPFRKLSK